MKADKLLACMDFMMKLLKNMGIITHGDFLLKFLVN
jgi:hypothetical protein